ncbi:hypothetical protein EXIGLDRAFT_701133 [Exidia glandulosa HHB12029]|uniref:Uncharacterized protein n=1 Tax=Exidia glandulosa HHB12029 TaxID=1314781 RepID=A0A165D3D3_EXIGL|nr:hypothetical protein EXIGLDRAFT_701133 [Exidia glandulosa HHB12029]
MSEAPATANMDSEFVHEEMDLDPKFDYTLAVDPADRILQIWVYDEDALPLDLLLRVRYAAVPKDANLWRAEEWTPPPTTRPKRPGNSNACAICHTTYRDAPSVGFRQTLLSWLEWWLEMSRVLIDKEINPGAYNLYAQTYSDETGWIRLAKGIRAIPAEYEAFREHVCSTARREISHANFDVGFGQFVRKAGITVRV